MIPPGYLTQLFLQPELWGAWKPRMAPSATVLAAVPSQPVLCHGRRAPRTEKRSHQSNFFVIRPSEHQNSAEHNSRRQCPSCNTLRSECSHPSHSFPFILGTRPTGSMLPSLPTYLSACRTYGMRHICTDTRTTHGTPPAVEQPFFFFFFGDADFPINTTHKPQAIHCRDDTCLQTFSPLQCKLQPQASHSTMSRAGCTQEPGSSYSGCQAWVSMSSSQACSAPSEHKPYWFSLVLVLGATWGISNDTELIWHHPNGDRAKQA